MLESLAGLTFDDVLLRPQHGVLDSRKDADISVPELSLSIPLISAPMPSVASAELIYTMLELGGQAVINRMGVDIKTRVDYAISFPEAYVGIGTKLDEFDQFYNRDSRRFCLDVAHADSERAISFIEEISKADIELIAGSIATYEGACRLIEAGATALRVGIGPGSVCTTRQVTGFGVPQLEAIQDCRRGNPDIPIIADGGIRNSGDIVKALAAGADAVMIGGLFARSVEADARFHYGNASYRVNGHRAPEGIELEIDGDKEPLENIVKRLTWGIRSGISYAGATNIKELQENAQWIRLTDAGRKESKL